MQKFFYPKWTIGPSGPTGIPLDTAKTQDKNFTAKVFTLNIWRTIVPFKKAIISGNPDPPALGLSSCNKGNEYFSLVSFNYFIYNLI